jgi:hypothetical protein
MKRIVLMLPLVAGCSLIDAATKDKPNATQQNAIGDTFTQLGTIADVASDPAATSSSDLATAVEVRHFARLVNPSVAKRAGRAAARPAALPGCVSDDGTSVTVDSCDIRIDDGRTCQVNGNIAYQELGEATRYEGTLDLGGAGCPDGNVTFNVVLAGPSSSPTSVSGNATFTWVDEGGDDYSGMLELDDVAVSGTCTVPSSGQLSVTVHGEADGESVEGAITLSFHESPGCGVILIE